MPLLFACAQGHQWEADVPAGDSPPACPECGGPGGATLHAGASESAPAHTPPALRFLPPLTTRLPPTVFTPRAPVVPAPPPVIAGYEILDELGSGGMGVVYKARQVSLNRLVALKMILPGAGASANELARFAAEAEVAARLQHPNIVQIYEVGEHAGRPYLALELVEGGSLASQLSGTPLPAEPAARLTATLARAVHHAHQRGVLHRDLKPANVLVGPAFQPDSSTKEVRLESRTCKIADFGLAKVMGQDSGQTRTGAIMGTPSYMAPEQAEGHTREAGPAADVYSLGAILYECLTGRPPFKGTTVLDTLEQVRSREPVPVRSLAPGVPRDLETVCHKCLRKEPDKRYASAAELADDLDRWLKGEPIRARPVGWWERGWKLARRRPAETGLLAVSVLAAAALGAGILWHQASVRAERDRAELAFQRKALEVVDVMLTEVAQKHLVHEPRMEDKRRELLQRALAVYKEFLANRATDPTLRAETARAYMRLADIQRMLGDYKDAEPNYRQAIELLESLATEAPGHRRDLAACENYLGEVLANTARPDEAEAAYRRAAALQEALTTGPRPDPLHWQDLVRTHINLGILLDHTRKPTPAEQEYRAAIRLIGDHPGMPDADFYLSKAYLNLGPLLRRSRRPDKAREGYLKAIKHLGRLTRAAPQNPEYRYVLAVTYNNLGVALGPVQGSELLRVDYHRQARDLLDRLVADYGQMRHYRQELANTYNSLGGLYAVLGTDQADEAWEQAQRLLEPLAAEPGAPLAYRADLGRTIGNRGWLRYDRKTRVEKGRLIVVAAEGLLNRPVASFAWLTAELHHLQAARGLLQPAVAGLEDALRASPKDPAICDTLCEHYQNLAATLVDLGEHGPAVEAAAGLARVSPTRGQDCYTAACFTARCVPLAARDARLPPARRHELARRYADRAVALLQEAVENGFARAGDLRRDAATLLWPVAARPDFQRVAAEVDKKTAVVGHPIP